MCLEEDVVTRASVVVFAGEGGGVVTLQIGCTELASCSGSKHGCMETYQKYIDICLPINASTSSTDDKLPVLSYHLTILTD